MSRKEVLPPVRGERAAQRRERASRIYEELQRAYPDARCALNYRSPFELLVATILSAQCTDKRVNEVTPALFARYPDPEAVAGADAAELEELIRPTGFFRQKTKSLIGTSQMLLDEFDGNVPRSIAELTRLPGVARKTANVVLGDCFPDDVEGVAVDTHVQRIARRLGLTRAWETDEIERDLKRLLPKERWPQLTHLLIEHGRAVCKAQHPNVQECPIASLCPSHERFAYGDNPTVRRARRG